MGTVGLWHTDDQPDHEVHLVGMWVATVARGTDVRPASSTPRWPRRAPATTVLLDVAHENTRARDFYLRMGFRPTGQVDTMPWDPTVTEETLALDLAVGP